MAEYESKLFSLQSLLKNYKVKDYESGHVFEQKIIYDLKTENERLKGIIATKGRGGGGSINTYDEEEDVSQRYIQKRLYDFNNKLEEIIQEKEV